MNFVVIDEEELVRERPKAISRFLLPLAMKPAVACASPKSLIEGGRVFAAHDGQVSGKEYRDWRFTSKHRNIICQYFELWRPTDSHKKWLLDRAYLTLFLTDRISRQPHELLCFHSDPNNTDSGSVQMFKKGPHLHVMHEEKTLRHAHFPMTIGYADEAVKSVSELTRVFREIVTLLSIEVVDRFEDAAVPC